MGDISLAIPLFVLCELQAGARLSSNPRAELRKIEFFQELVDVIYPMASFAGIYGDIEGFLRRNGTPVPTMDLLIAVTALSQSSPLLTRNIKDFQLIPNLVVEEY
jgi:tRNA(fMet)-specific endonuclease VapC